MTYSLRRMQEQDWEAACAIRNTLFPEQATLEVFSEWCRLDPERNTHYIDLVAVDEQGEVAGYALACTNKWMKEGEWWLLPIVRPDLCGQGAGRLLYAEAERMARELGATAILSDCRDDEGLAFAQRRGFVLTRERLEFVADLADWNRAPFAAAIARAESTGIQFAVLAELNEEEQLGAYYDFEAAVKPDLPGFEPPFAAYEHWVKGYVGEARDRTPKRYVLAFDGDRVAGACVVRLPRGGQGEGADVDFTGVRREYRGRGLALALKVLATDATHRAGAPHMRTRNDSDNPAILALNRKLGYRQVPGWRWLRKTI
jgi:GNAT superfamily N-acetyltransferase